MTAIDDFDSLNSAFAENLTQTLITLISAQEKLEELEKYKVIIRNATSSLGERSEKNFNKIKALLAGIQIGKQMLINRAKSIYLFDNIDDLASTLTINHRSSVENLFSSTNCQQQQQTSDNSNRISSYLNIVTSTMNPACGKTTTTTTTCTIPQQDLCSMKCVSAYMGANNEQKKAEIAPKKVTPEYAEFDIRYPPTKIDIFYPRAKINICSDTPQIDLKLPDPLIEYKSFYTPNNNNSNFQNQTSSITFSENTKNTGKVHVHSYKPTMGLDSFKQTTTTTTMQDNARKNACVNIRQSLTSVSCKAPTSAVACKSSEQETENFIQAMIDKGCTKLLQELLHKYMSLDKCVGYFESFNKEKEYNQWLMVNYSINEQDAARLQSYIETWYMNCMMEKLDLSNNK